MCLRSSWPLLSIGLLVFSVGTIAHADVDEAAACMRMDDLHGVLHALEGVEGSEAGYLRGRALEALQRPGPAAQAFDGLQDLPRRVLLDASFRRALALARSSQCALAQPALDAVSRRTHGPTRAAVARAVSAECALQRGDLTAAEAGLRAAMNDNGREVDTFAVTVQLADVLAQLERSDEARTLLRGLYLARPAHPDAAEVIRYGFDPDTLSPRERLDRANSWLSARQPSRAVAELRGYEPPANLRAEWAHVFGMALFGTREDYPEAAIVLDRAWRLGGENAIDDRFHAARALSRADDDSQAIHDYRALVRAHGRHPRARKAEYLAAWLQIRLEPRRGEAALERFLRGPRGTGDLAANAAWHLGLSAFERGSFRRASRFFERYAGSGEGLLVEGRGRYWQGRALENEGRRTAAKRAYAQVVAMDPLHWYGLWATRRLRAMGEEVQPYDASGVGAAEPPTDLPEGIPNDAALYHRLGLRQDALDALRRAERQVRAAAPSGRVNAHVVRAYEVLGGASRAFRLASREHRRLRQAPVGDARWAWEAAYPRPHEQAVRREAEALGVPFEQVYATMRQESAYDENAVSRTDAIGLLQVMPEVGERLARREGVRFERRQLFEPASNVHYGVIEIADLRQRFDGSLVLSVAGFNAGAARVERWVDEAGACDVDLFVEKIPFDETRGYVRRVISHFARYRYLEDPAQAVPLQARFEARPASGMDLVTPE